MNKLIYTIVFIIFIVSANAQVGIETDNVSDKAILDFPDNADGGILLPYVADMATAGDVAGALLYSAQDGNIYVKDNNGWVKLTQDLKDSNNKVAHDPAFEEMTNAEGVVISNTGQEPTAKGVLVLESTDRALALPKVNGVENIPSPKTGMICYDTSRKSFAIFNGEKWILRN